MDKDDQYYEEFEKTRKDVMKKRLGGLFLVVDLLLIAYIIFQITLLLWAIWLIWIDILIRIV